MRRTIEAPDKEKLSPDERQFIALAHPLWEHGKKWAKPDHLDAICLYCDGGKACISIDTSSQEQSASNEATINEWASDLEPWEREVLRRADIMWEIISRHTPKGKNLEEVKIGLVDEAFTVSIRHEEE